MSQTGGAINLLANNLRISISQIDEPWKLVIGFLLVFLIIYSERFSDMLGYQTHISLRSLGGRLIGVTFVLLVATTVGWVYGLLSAIAFLLIMRDDAMVEEKEKEVTVEQFSDLVVKARQGNKWFIERALNEEPTLIEEDRVETAAIQG